MGTASGDLFAELAQRGACYLCCSTWDVYLVANGDTGDELAL